MDTFEGTVNQCIVALDTDPTAKAGLEWANLKTLYGGAGEKALFDDSNEP